MINAVINVPRADDKVANAHKLMSILEELGGTCQTASLPFSHKILALNDPLNCSKHRSLQRLHSSKDM